MPGAVEIEAPVADEPDDDVVPDAAPDDAAPGAAGARSPDEEAGDPRDATEEPPLR
jgi:hypothetical protein